MYLTRGHGGATSEGAAECWPCGRAVRCEATAEDTVSSDWSTDEAARRWDLHAEALTAGYTAEGDVHRAVLLNPTLLELLGPVQGKRILDAGCGEGYLSRMLASAGARVVGVDYSGKMIEIARSRTPGDLAIEYVHGNCENLEFIASGGFDIVVSNMVLQDLADYRAAIAELHRVLAPGGALIFAILHPCFSTPGSGWVTDENERKLHWQVDGYFGEGVIELEWPRGAEQGLLYFRRTLTSYFEAVRNVGFVIDRLVEPKPSEEMLVKYPEFGDDLRMCHFLVLRAIKQAR
ncbi:MAG: class I SAM-dependent methyltransferase [Armatimonadota bacterium]|nr:MAG: class I SAM-dependent methyltransferase [Armatimonadota bacterium]